MSGSNGDTKVRTASRSTGGDAMIDSSRTPVSASCSVRGIGVAVSVSTWTSARNVLQPLLVRDAEMLLLVDDEQAEVLEFDGLAEQRVRADHDVDCAVGELLLGLRQFLAGHQSRGLRDVDREAAKALGEGLHVLAREQRRRHHDRDLLAAHRGNEGGAQRHLGLAEADIAADQPIHRPSRREIVEHGVDRGLLVVRFLIGEAGAELVVRPDRRGEARGFAQLPLGRDLDQARPPSRGCAASSAPCAPARPPPPSRSSSTPASSEP